MDYVPLIYNSLTCEEGEGKTAKGYKQKNARCYNNNKSSTHFTCVEVCKATMQQHLSRGSSKDFVLLV